MLQSLPFKGVSSFGGARRHSCFEYRKSGPRSTHPRTTCLASKNISSVPESEEELIFAAAACLKDQLQTVVGRPKNKAFGKGSQGPQKFSLEISWADTSPQSVVQLVQGLFSKLDSNIRDSLSVAFYDVEAALLASDRLQNEVRAVDDLDDRSSRCYSPALLVVGVPTGQEDAAIDSLNWRGSALILLSLDTNSLEANFPVARRGFRTIYAFEAFAMKGWIRSTDGVAIKQMRSGAPAGWQIYKRQSNSWKLIGRSPERPTATTVELALYNSSAAENPINKGIGAIRSAMGRK